jgi:hypothetical protein
MSANKSRRVGAPAFPGKKPGLQLVKSPEERPRPEPDPELKAIVEDLDRRARARRERSWRGPEDKDAA